MKRNGVITVMFLSVILFLFSIIVAMTILGIAFRSTNKSTGLLASIPWRSTIIVYEKDKKTPKEIFVDKNSDGNKVFCFGGEDKIVLTDVNPFDRASVIQGYLIGGFRDYLLNNKFVIVQPSISDNNYKKALMYTR